MNFKKKKKINRLMPYNSHWTSSIISWNKVFRFISMAFHSAWIHRSDAYCAKGEKKIDQSTDTNIQINLYSLSWLLLEYANVSHLYSNYILHKRDSIAAHVSYIPPHSFLFSLCAALPLFFFVTQLTLLIHYWIHTSFDCKYFCANDSCPSHYVTHKFIKSI